MPSIMLIMLQLASATDNWFLALVFYVFTLLALEYRKIETSFMQMPIDNFV